MAPETVFETARLTCRRWRPSDLAPLVAVNSDVEGARWVGNGQPITLAECEAWLRVTDANHRLDGYGMFALDERVSGQMIGFLGLVHPGGQGDAEVKYSFLRSQWGQGLASEAVSPLLACGAAHHGLTKITDHVFHPEEALADNIALLANGARAQNPGLLARIKSVLLAPR